MKTDHDRQFLVYEIEDILIRLIDYEAESLKLLDLERPKFLN